MSEAVTVVPYDTRWPERFERIAEELRGLLGRDALAVHHIGSTAVPGLVAKPIIDVLPVVLDLDAVDHATPAFVRGGYEAMGEYGIPGRRLFVRKRGGQRWAHAHVFAEGDPGVARHLAFRDYLRVHPEEAERYAAIKVAAAQQHGHDRKAYSRAKGSFVQATERRALAWAEAM